MHCNKCGKVKVKKETFAKLELNTFKEESYKDLGTTRSIEYDLCNKCALEVMNLIGVEFIAKERR